MSRAEVVRFEKENKKEVKIKMKERVSPVGSKQLRLPRTVDDVLDPCSLLHNSHLHWASVCVRLACGFVYCIMCAFGVYARLHAPGLTLVWFFSLFQGRWKVGLSGKSGQLSPETDGKFGVPDYRPLSHGPMRRLGAYFQIEGSLFCCCSVEPEPEPRRP